jgi:hypothetical protein
MMIRLTSYGIACAVVLGFALMSVRERAWAEQAVESESLIVAGERISVPTPEGLVPEQRVSGDLKDTIDAMVGPGIKSLFVTPEDQRSISAGSEPKLAHYALAPVGRRGWKGSWRLFGGFICNIYQGLRRPTRAAT